MEAQAKFEVVTAENFLKIWDGFARKFVDDRNLLLGKYLTSWKYNTLWTKEILGDASTENKSSPLGEYLTNCFKNVRYRAEEWKVDLVLAKEENHSSLKDMSYNDSSLLPIDAKWFFPPYYQALIEHENNIELCYEEMVKLTYLRARLKILITYNYEFSDQTAFTEIEKTINYARNNFQKIIRHTNSEFPENEDTEYVLIVGQSFKGSLGTFLRWYKFAFSVDGTEKKN